MKFLIIIICLYILFRRIKIKIKWWNLMLIWWKYHLKLGRQEQIKEGLFITLQTSSRKFYQPRKNEVQEVQYLEVPVTTSMILQVHPTLKANQKVKVQQIRTEELKMWEVELKRCSKFHNRLFQALNQVQLDSKFKNKYKKV